MPISCDIQTHTHTDTHTHTRDTIAFIGLARYDSLELSFVSAQSFFIFNCNRSLRI